MLAIVTMRASVFGQHREIVDQLSRDWVAFLNSMGITPIPMLNTLLNPAQFLIKTSAELLLLTNGNNLGPRHGEKVTWDDISIERDSCEKELVQTALNHGIPILGVCRGFQHINALFGGSIIRDVHSLANSIPHAGTTHGLDLLNKNLVKRTGLKKVETNSYHNQGIGEDNLAPELLPFAQSPDGLIEGLYHPRKSVVAIQWHPERPGSNKQFDQLIIEAWKSPDFRSELFGIRSEGE